MVCYLILDHKNSLNSLIGTNKEYKTNLELFATKYLFIRLVPVFQRKNIGLGPTI